METILSLCQNVTYESFCSIPSLNGEKPLQISGSAFHCAKQITQTERCIRNEEHSAFPEIIDALKKMSEKKPKKKRKPNKKAKKPGTPDITENGHENKENAVCNGHATDGQRVSHKFEHDLNNLTDIISKMRVDDSTNAHSAKSAEPITGNATGLTMT